MFSTGHLLLSCATRNKILYFLSLSVPICKIGTIIETTRGLPWGFLSWDNSYKALSMRPRPTGWTVILCINIQDCDIFHNAKTMWSNFQSGEISNKMHLTKNRSISWRSRKRLEQQEVRRWAQGNLPTQMLPHDCPHISPIPPHLPHFLDPNSPVYTTYTLCSPNRDPLEIIPDPEQGGLRCLCPLVVIYIFTFTCIHIALSGTSV